MEKNPPWPPSRAARWDLPSRSPAEGLGKPFRMGAMLARRARENPGKISLCFMKYEENMKMLFEIFLTKR